MKEYLQIGGIDFFTKRNNEINLDNYLKKKENIERKKLNLVDYINEKNCTEYTNLFEADNIPLLRIAVDYGWDKIEASEMIKAYRKDGINFNDPEMKMWYRKNIPIINYGSILVINAHYLYNFVNKIKTIEELTIEIFFEKLLAIARSKYPTDENISYICINDIDEKYINTLKLNFKYLSTKSEKTKTHLKNILKCYGNEEAIDSNTLILIGDVVLKDYELLNKKINDSEVEVYNKNNLEKINKSFDNDRTILTVYSLIMNNSNKCKITETNDNYVAINFEFSEGFIGTVYGTRLYLVDHNNIKTAEKSKKSKKSENLNIYNFDLIIFPKDQDIVSKELYKDKENFYFLVIKKIRSIFDKYSNVFIMMDYKYKEIIDGNFNYISASNEIYPPKDIIEKINSNGKEIEPLESYILICNKIPQLYNVNFKIKEENVKNGGYLEKYMKYKSLYYKLTNQNITNSN